MSEIVVSKFGGTSVADFDAMNRSADIVLSDANVRLVVLSASAGITNSAGRFSGRAGTWRAIRKTRRYSQHPVCHSGTSALPERYP